MKRRDHLQGRRMPVRIELPRFDRSPQGQADFGGAGRRALEFDEGILGGNSQIVIQVTLWLSVG